MENQYQYIIHSSAIYMYIQNMKSTWYNVKSYKQSKLSNVFNSRKGIKM